jgi:hypothetical protein
VLILVDASAERDAESADLTEREKDRATFTF